MLGRSECDHCHKVLGIADLIPIVSWLLLGRRCRHCGARLSWFYPLVEIAALIPVVWSAFYMSGWLLGASAIMGWTLIALALIDWRTFRLPDGLTLFLLLSGLIASFGFDRSQWAGHLIGAVAGFVIFSLIALAYRRLRGRDGLGFGDAKLLAGLGAWISWGGLPATIFMAAASALVFAIIRSLIKKDSVQARIPFGPFLALAGWIVWLYGPLVLGG